MKKKLCWVSDNPKYTFVGQSRVTREFCFRLASDYDIVVVGFNGPKPELEYKANWPFPIFTVPRDEMGINHEALVKILQEQKPDILVLSHDCFLFSGLHKIKAEFPNMKIIGYFTIDGEPISRFWKSVLYSCDRIITPTNYGKNKIYEVYLDLLIDVVPYGLDKSFVPCENKDLARHIFDRDSEKSKFEFEMEGKFVCLYYGQNQQKKNLHAARLGWEKFIENKSDACFLMLVHSRRISTFGFEYVGDNDLYKFVQTKNLIVIDGVIGDSDLIKVIQISDCLVFPSIGEGMGLPILEAMAVGSVPIVCNYAGSTDFTNDENSFMLKKWIPFYGPFDTIRALADPIEIAEKLEVAYSLWKEKKLDIKAKKCIETASNYNWDKSAALFKKSIEEVLTRPSRMQLLFEVN